MSQTNTIDIRPEPSISGIQGADNRFYTNVVNQLSAQIGDASRKIEEIDRQAQKLLDSKRSLESDRERLAEQRNAARIALRHLEDSEAKRGGNRT